MSVLLRVGGYAVVEATRTTALVQFPDGHVEVVPRADVEETIHYLRSLMRTPERIDALRIYERLNQVWMGSSAVTETRQQFYHPRPNSPAHPAPPAHIYEEYHQVLSGELEDGLRYYVFIARAIADAPVLWCLHGEPKWRTEHEQTADVCCLSDRKLAESYRSLAERARGVR